MEKTIRFFDFEVQNNLFNVRDKKGLYPWEAVRYWVSFNLEHTNTIAHTTRRESLLSNICSSLKQIIEFFFYIVRHRHCRNMMILSSRDKRNGLYYDKICEDFYGLLNIKETLTLESIYPSKKNSYKYSGFTCSNLLETFLSHFPIGTFDFTEIHKLIKTHFPEFSMTVSDLNSLYRIFVSQYIYYKFIFKYCGIKRVYMIQNGIKKGLFAAANELGIEVVEFQHGQISRNHLAYSYPESIENAINVYHPNKLLLFGEIWKKDRSYPGVENIVIGNNSYAGKNTMPDTHGNKIILVISNREEGEMLSNLVKQILEIDKGFSFFFKLHPNQYREKDLYESCFNDYPNVEVVTDSATVNKLLEQSEGILVVQSTAELEALQAGRKVFVLKAGSYEFMDFVFVEKGVYLISDHTEFVESYNFHKEEKLEPRHDIFVPFRDNVACRLLEEL